MMANQVYGLALDYLDKAEEDSADGDVTGSTPVKASLAFKVTWPAGAEAPVVNTKVSYTRSVKDETEDTYDPNQVKMHFAETETTEQD